MFRHRAPLLLLGLVLATAVLAQDIKQPTEWAPSINVNVRLVDHAELPYVLREGNYDRRPLEGLSEPEIHPEIVPGLDRRLPMLPSRVDTALPEPTFDVFTGTSSSQGPAPTIAVGPGHIVTVSSQGISAYTKAGSAVILPLALPVFFNSNTATEPRVIWDSTYSRYVVIALDVDFQAPDADLLAAVSDDADPSGNWFMLRVPTYLPAFDPDGPGPRPAGPHVPSNPMIGMEENQIYISFEMRTPNAPAFDGTAVWNLWKWTNVTPSPAGGFYSGSGTTTIQAALRPFSVGNDYGNEVPLTPVTINGSSPAGSFANRGIYLAGYGGKTFSSAPTLQVFWVSVVGPSVSKMLVPLGISDNVAMALPGAPQPGTATLIPTGKRNVYSATWEADQIWLTTMVVPATGPDAGEATASWLWIDAPTTSGLTLGESGTVSGDELVDDTYTFNASIVRSNTETVGVSFSAAASQLPLSSLVSFIGPFCNEPNVQLAPDFLRVGTSSWAGSLWGPVSGIGADGNCIWSHNAHATPGGGGSWTSSVGKFCREPGLVFKDGFETGKPNGWCQTLP